MRFILQVIGGIIVLVVAFINILEYTAFVSRFPARNEDAMVIWETRFAKLHNQLIRERYTTGKIGFVTARSLQHLALTEQDDQDWAALRYTSIPLLLTKDELDLPYIIADFTHDPHTNPMIDGFSQIEQSGDGLVLYKRNSVQ